MNLYRSTINMAGCKRGQTNWFPDTPRTAVLVANGVLVPVDRGLVEPGDAPLVAEPGFVPRPPVVVDETSGGVEEDPWLVI